MQPFSILREGLKRVGVLRVDGSGPVENIGLWLHGGTGSGQIMLSHVPVMPGWLHVCPTALVANNGHTAWVPPGLSPTDPFYAPDIPNDTHDVGLQDDVLARYSSLHPDAELWAGGMSKGGELILGAHAWADELGLATFRRCRSLWIGHAGVPFVPEDGPPPFLGWGFAERVAAGKVTPRSVLFVHGGGGTDTTSQRYAGGASWEESAQALAASAGVALGAWGPGNPSPCCEYELRKRAGATSSCAMVELEFVDGPHAFMSCGGFNEIGRAMAFDGRAP